MAPIKISVIISTYNRCTYLRDTVESLLTQGFPADLFEIIIVDNNCTDGTKELVNSYGKMSRPVIQYVQEKQPGLSHARNRGVRQAQGPIVAFIDDDAVADRGWLSALLDVYEHDPAAGVVGGRIDLLWLTEKPVWVTRTLEMSFGALDFGNTIQEIHYPHTPFGGNFSISRQLFLDIGGFSSQLGRKASRPFSHEELLLCCLAAQHQKKIYFTPHALVHHKVLPERLNRRRYMRQAYYQGMSAAVVAAKIQDTEQISAAGELQQVLSIAKNMLYHIVSAQHIHLTEDVYMVSYTIGKLRQKMFLKK